jgi:hypothetical protein
LARSPGTPMLAPRRNLNKQLLDRGDQPGGLRQLDDQAPESRPHARWSAGSTPVFKARASRHPSRRPSRIRRAYVEHHRLDQRLASPSPVALQAPPGRPEHRTLIPASRAADGPTSRLVKAASGHHTTTTSPAPDPSRTDRAGAPTNAASCRRDRARRPSPPGGLDRPRGRPDVAPPIAAVSGSVNTLTNKPLTGRADVPTSA